MNSDYRVELDLFSGPLDLLLYLIRRNEVDIREVALAEVTSQYVAYLELLQWLDLDETGEFLLVASTLIEIKSRSVLPREEEQEDEAGQTDEGQRSELVRRLLEYREFKEAAQELSERASRWQERYPRLSIEQPSEDAARGGADRIREVELWDLVSALGRLLQDKEVVGEERLRRDDVPVAKLVEQIAERVRHEGRLPFSRFFEGTNERARIVGVFLAILELVRHHGFGAEQPEERGEIWIAPPDESEDGGNEGGF